jgi:isopentenyl diphosphate isomerase/L-lactate dehydrogenase-like FMN-dependent dehydrogenase
MAVLTAGVAVKDDLLRELGVTTDYADDAEYQRDVREIYESNRARVLQKTMSEKMFDEVMRRCRDRDYVKEVAENLRELARIRKFWDVRVVELGITEEDVAQAIREVKDEERAEMEQAADK